MPFTKGHTLWKHPNSVKTQFQKGGAGHLGFQHSEISNEKNRIAHLGTKLGEENPSWKGGTTPFLNKIKRFTEYKTWQRGVMERDNFSCRKCGIRGGDLTAHHLTSFSFLVNTVFEIRTLKQARDCFALWKIRHGVTLCRDCHKETPNFSWRANETPRDRTVYPAILGIILFVFFAFPSFSQAATFGYTTIGGTAINQTGDELDLAKYTLSEAGDISKLTFYSERSGASGTTNQKGVIYDDDGASGEPATQLAVGSVVNADTNPAWRDSTMTVSLAAGDYWLALANETANDNYYKDSAGISRWKSSAGYYATPPNPWPNATDNHTTNKFSIYATYTASGGAGECVLNPNGDSWITSECYIYTNTTTQGIIHLIDGADVHCINSAIIEAEGLTGDTGSTLTGKSGCKLKLWRPI